jgi:hypothetical protein
MRPVASLLNPPPPPPPPNCPAGAVPGREPSNVSNGASDGGAGAVVESSEGSAGSAASTPGDSGGSAPGSGGMVPSTSDAERQEVKARLKDIMQRLVQRDQSGSAMQELYLLKR